MVRVTAVNWFPSLWAAVGSSVTDASVLITHVALFYCNIVDCISSCYFICCTSCHVVHLRDWIFTVYTMFLFRFMEPSMIVVLGGILPFGSIFIEMYV